MQSLPPNIIRPYLRASILSPSQLENAGLLLRLQNLYKGIMFLPCTSISLLLERHEFQYNSTPHLLAQLVPSTITLYINYLQLDHELMGYELELANFKLIQLKQDYKNTSTKYPQHFTETNKVYLIFVTGSLTQVLGYVWLVWYRCFLNTCALQLEPPPLW